jgi:hypothetical protein
VGLGPGALAPIPNPQSPIPNPQSPSNTAKIMLLKLITKNLKIKWIKI